MMHFLLWLIEHLLLRTLPGSYLAPKTKFLMTLSPIMLFEREVSGTAVRYMRWRMQAAGGDQHVCGLANHIWRHIFSFLGNTFPNYGPYYDDGA